MRVPFFVYWKDRVKPGTSDHICALYDFLATAADIAGIEPPQSDGISLLPAVSGNAKKQKEHDYLYWENGTHTPQARSLRYGKWWAFSPHPDQAPELYDLEKDMQCRNNLADENPEVIAKVLAIFESAHEDSKWYRNPGESDEKWKEKINAAEKEGSLQNPTRANTTFSKKSETHYSPA
jgi:arylsulfatase A-like enzyme